ncbi:DUF1566 domain-containing protein [Alkalimonas sp. NCh-2]|uniref:Lcl C-terminal domain-containing protein n=1 Tax=Alkalimonas sp. NCh-2 TaxID=3144846 RepID=UPI0031F6D4DD
MTTINIKAGKVSITLNDSSESVHGVDFTAVTGQQPDLEWSATLLDGESVTYEKAEKAVAELGECWRLPTRQELESLLDLTRHEPAIDTEKYPDTKSTYYWTSTPCAWNSAARWVVYFGNGDVLDHPQDYHACVRAVRASQ